MVPLAADIGEAKDLTTSHPDKVKELKAAWDSWNAELAKPLWQPNPAGGKKKGKAKKKTE